MQPITTAPHISIVPHPAVTATRPPNAPFMARGNSKASSPLCPLAMAPVNKAVAAPVAAASVVLTAVRAADAPVSGESGNNIDDPPLKPYPDPKEKRRDLREFLCHKLSGCAISIIHLVFTYTQTTTSKYPIAAGPWNDP